MKNEIIFARLDKIKFHKKGYSETSSNEVLRC